MLNELAQRVHENAKSKGFFENEKNIGEMLCLIHSEVSEALEADRKKQYYANSDVFKVGLIKEMTEKELGAVFFEESVFKAEFERSVKNTFEDLRRAYLAFVPPIVL